MMSDYTDIVPEIQRIKSQIYNLRKQVVETCKNEDRLSVKSIVVRLDDIDRNMEDIEEICSVLADKLEEKYSDPPCFLKELEDGLKELEDGKEEFDKKFAALCKDSDELAANIKIIKKSIQLIKIKEGFET